MRAAVLPFGGELIVGSAKDSQIGWLTAATFAARMAVVDLEPCLGSAARAVDTDPGARQSVPRDDRSFGIARDIR